MYFVMPNMDGPTATAEIRSMGFKGPIFGVTGNALTSDIQLFIERGATNVFLKPVDMNALDRALRGKFFANYFIGPFFFNYVDAEYFKRPDYAEV